MNAPASEPSKLIRKIANLKGPVALTWVLTDRSGFFEMEVKMRRTVIAAAATVSMLAGVAAIPQSAEAMSLPAQAGIATAARTTNLAQDIAYVCRRVWRCGPYGCGWRRSCYYTRPYYWRPYYRRHYYYRRW